MKITEGGGSSLIGSVKIPSKKIVENLPWTCKKLHCKGEPAVSEILRYR